LAQAISAQAIFIYRPDQRSKHTCPMVRFLLVAALASGVESVSVNANPIRRVVTLLQQMQAQVTKEGKAEEDLFNKFVCYCKTGSGDLSASITAAEGKITQDTSSLEESSALQVQLNKDLVDHKDDRADAKDAVGQAKALREREAAVFAKESSDDKTNIAALGKAIAALEKGSYGAFLQTSAASRIRDLSINMDMSSADRDMLTAFISQPAGTPYAPKAGEIIGILKQMKDTMEADLADITKTEEKAIADFEALVASKTQQIQALTHSIETKTAREGEVGVEIVDLKEALDDTSVALLADKKFFNNLGETCDKKKADWEERSKTRTQELAALADAIRLLNDDDSLQLFKKSLPSPSFIQVKETSRSLRERALKVLRAKSDQRDHRMDLVMLALSGNSKGFGKVTQMIDEMVVILGKEQSDDDAKKTFCEAELDSAEDKHKELERDLADLDKAIDVTEEAIGNLKAEIAALVAGIQALDKSVAEATADRKAENAEFKSTMAANKATKELLVLVQNHLNQFYNPSLYVPPAKTELGAEQRIAVNSGSEEAPTVQPSGIAGTGITYLQSAPVFAQVSMHDSAEVAPAPPPETWDAYQKKGQEHSGVTVMMNMLIGDIDKDTQAGTVDEKNAQAEYETLMGLSRGKRAEDTKLVADKEAAKADHEARLQRMTAEHKGTQKEAMSVAESIKDLHLECDWLVANYEARKSARAGEVDSLQNAKAILAGSDYSFVQVSRVSLRGA